MPSGRIWSTDLVKKNQRQKVNHGLILGVLTIDQLGFPLDSGWPPMKGSPYLLELERTARRNLEDHRFLTTELAESAGRY